MFVKGKRKIHLEIYRISTSGPNTLFAGTGVRVVIAER
jgi:hypothetical protein